MVIFAEPGFTYGNRLELALDEGHGRPASHERNEYIQQFMNDPAMRAPFHEVLNDGHQRRSRTSLPCDFVLGAGLRGPLPTTGSLKFFQELDIFFFAT